MKIILLSGGSGKRLWPLSNDSRSKQFLPVLRAPDGSPESMIQRVVRQLRDAGFGQDITIASNAGQKGILMNQLGEETEIIAEPERRDTFPAVALACQYLSKVRGCPDDEVVAVMPCDPFTTDGYFRVIGEMAEAVRQDRAQLVLMGITPDRPSSKFGYIVPEGKGETPMKVRRFTEKPPVEEAERLLEEGALWNGGVFVFRLGHITSISDKYQKHSDFRGYIENYAQYPRTSFDREVVEKARDVAVIPFDGEWKDLGTWNTLSGELGSPSLGNVVMGEHNSNTHVVNELGIPVFCDGMKDAVVACSPDGILVCAKNDTETLKDYTDRLVHRPMYEERRWGTSRVIDCAEYPDGFKTVAKVIAIKAGGSINYHLHRRRDEVWTIVNGTGLLALDGKVSVLERGQTVRIGAGMRHAVKADGELTIIEVQMGGVLSEEDIETFPWDWKDR